MAKDKNSLTPKQLLFVKEYIIDFNASRAALKAEYSKKTAPFIGAENLKKPKIQVAIQKEIEKRADRIERTGDEVVLRLWKMQDIDYADYSDKRQVKTIELLLRHYGLLNDKLQVGLDEAQLNDVLAGLASVDPKFAESVKKALMEKAAQKKKP